MSTRICFMRTSIVFRWHLGCPNSRSNIERNALTARSRKVYSEKDFGINVGCLSPWTSVHVNKPPHKWLPQAARHRDKSHCKYVRVKQHICLCRSTHIERSIGLLDVRERSLTQTTTYLLALEIETRQSTRQGAAWGRGWWSRDSCRQTEIGCWKGWRKRAHNRLLVILSKRDGREWRQAFRG